MKESNYLEGMRGRRLSRRTVLRGATLGAAGLAGAVLLGCGDDDDESVREDAGSTPQPGATTAQPAATVASRPGGKLTIAVADLGTENTDPTLGGTAAKIYLELIYDSIVGVDAVGVDISTATGLAETWEVSADKLTWTLKIRPGVQFHRGYGELTSEDVKFSIERVMSEESLAANKSGFLKSIETVETPDLRTVLIHLKKPWFNLPYAVSNFPNNNGMVMSKAYFDDVGEDEFRLSAVGTGPYEFVSLQTRTSLKLKAVEHWRGGLPAYDEIEFLVVPEATSRLALVQRGDAQMAGLSYALAASAEESGLDVREVTAGKIVGAFLFHQYGDVPFANKQFRAAMNHAIDRQGLSDALFAGRAHPAPSTQIAGPASSGARGWELEPYAYDPERARQLLKDSGVDNPTVEIVISPDYGVAEQLPTMMEAVGEQLEAIGISVTLSQLDRSTLVAKSREDDGLAHDVIAQWITSDKLFPDSALNLIHNKSGSIWQTRDDAELSALIDDLIASPDLDSYKASFQKIEQKIYDEYYQLPLLYLRSLWVTTPALIASDWPGGGNEAYTRGLRQMAAASTLAP